MQTAAQQRVGEKVGQAPPARRASRPVLGLLAGLAVVLLLAAPTARPLRSTAAQPAASHALGLEPPPAPWAEAAAAVRRGDLDAARRLVEPLAAADTRAAREARLALGLWALDAGELERAAILLRGAAEPGGRFDDWRLLALADCHRDLGRLPAAAATLRQLVDRLPESPLRVPALLRAVALASRQGDRRGALQLIDSARGERLTADETEELERTAWQIADDGGDAALARRLAARLLVRLPILASKLEVIELFRQPSGAIDWLSFLTADELVERAHNLLAAGITAGTLDALAAVPAARRDLDWKLLEAAALTAAGRGAEALARLATIEPAGGGLAIRIEELRAAAALEAARARPGRAPPAADERERLRGMARDALWRVVELAGDEPVYRESALAAHRRLLAELVDGEDELGEPAVAVARALGRLAPEDLTPAGILWRGGWIRYQRGELAAAITYWAELGAIYPASDLARAGRYWTARAHEALGNGARAAELYRAVASAGAEDFYHRHARSRLGGAAGMAVSPAPPGEAWPRDAALARARWLSDRGLDDAALVEIGRLAGRAEPRAAAAMKAVALARAGRRRDSIHALARAFPQLGGPRQESAPPEALRLYYPTDFEPIVRRFAGAHAIPAPLLFAMIRQESAFDSTAVSRSGALGLMQLMPATGRQLAERLRLRYSSSLLTDPEFNVRLGSRYFQQMLELFDGSEELALAAYNGGPNRIRRLWRDAGSTPELDRFVEGLELTETRRYVKRILLFRATYERLYDGRA